LSSGKRKMAAKQAIAVQLDGREKRGDATRTQLIEATIASVAKFGLEGTTVSRLAEISGVSRGLISFHFDGKDKLLEAALSFAITRYEDSWNDNVVTPAFAPAERLHKVVDHDLDFCVREPGIMALWWAAWGEARAKEIYRVSSSTRDERFVADLTTMFEDAGITRGKAKKAAELINASLLGFWLQRHVDEEGANVQLYRDAGHALVDALLLKEK
jgi:TetR/AcrR family transcriptional regulator, transcriptional repressor of bet genes